jgi:hypothetical protein
MGRLSGKGPVAVGGQAAGSNFTLQHSTLSAIQKIALRTIEEAERRTDHYEVY